jgi:3-dehydroquinate synthase
LFALLESGMEMQRIEEVIEGSLRIKRAVVEKDEKESGLRKILNFGHTLGHGIEAEVNLHGLYHGECVALGMLPMCSDQVRERLIPVLERMCLPTQITGELEKMLAAASHDKKCDGSKISVVWVEKIGSCELREMDIEDWKQQIRATMAKIGKD